MTAMTMTSLTKMIMMMTSFMIKCGPDDNEFDISIIITTTSTGAEKGKMYDVTAVYKTKQKKLNGQYWCSVVILASSECGDRKDYKDNVIYY